MPINDGIQEYPDCGPNANEGREAIYNSVGGGGATGHVE